jgi:lipid II:glycine glycyltransferase (peptidoglycan interpeptide bridge formation enzyme)
MPIVDVDENIKQTHAQLEKLTHEVFRLQGMLQTFESFKKGGVKTIELPNDPNQEVEEVDSIQEKPE